MQVLSGLMALETLRYLSRHDEPVARAEYHWIALAEGMAVGTDGWTFHPDCRHCAPNQTRLAEHAGLQPTVAS